MSDSRLHENLQVLLAKHGLNESDSLHSELMEDVSRAYAEFDLDRRMLERSLEINSRELVQANTDLQVLFKVIPDLLFRINDKGVVVDFKGGSENRLDLSRWSSVGCCLSELLPKEVYKVVAKAIADLKTSKIRVDTKIEITLDGDPVFFELRLLPLHEREILVMLRDITKRKQVEREIARGNQRLEKQNQILFDLAINPAVHNGDLTTAFSEITKIAAQSLNVERVSIWLYNDDKTRIQCADLYELSADRHSSAIDKEYANYPTYFDALSTGRAIAADDAKNNPSTKELYADYLLPNKISSLLDAPIRVGGKYIGILCHEHCGEPRKWKTDEQQFAASMADMVSLAYETSERQRAQKALTESEERFRILAESSSSAIFVFRENILYANPAMEYISDYTSNELACKTIADLFDEEFYQELQHRLTSPLDRVTGYIRREGKLRTKHFEHRWLYVTIGKVMLNDEVTFIASAFDITERKAMEEQLRHQAFHDKLTGLPNRALFMDRLEQSLSLSRRHKEYRSAVLFLDIDRFKIVNDSLGHLVGDKLLIEIGKRLRAQMRECDTIARLGGDEFTLLIGDTNNIEFALQVADRIQKDLSRPFFINGQEIFVSASIGIAQIDASYQRADHILRDADIAMYRAKSNGKACHEIFDSQMHKRAQRLLQLETDLHRAVSKDEFELYYQPIINLSTGQVNGFEALLRWNYSENEVSPPAEFIPLAEESGVIIPLGNWVIEQACKQMGQWRNLIDQDDFIMSINLSGKQFEQSDIYPKIAKLMQSDEMQASTIMFELTESTLMENSENVMNKLSDIKSLGSKLSIDDFGTGYSSLSYLHKFPIDILKIDQSFIEEIKGNGENTEIASAIISMAHSLGLKVIAEGVETDDQLQALINLKCDYAQGFLFSEAVPAQEAEKLMHRDWQSFHALYAKTTDIRH